MKPVQFVTLCIAATFCVSAAQKTMKAHFYEYDYNDSPQGQSPKYVTDEPLAPSVDKADKTYESSLENKIPRRPQIGGSALTKRMAEISTNADGVEIFMDALDQVMMSEESVVKIPEEIDPEQHTISLEDAFDRMEEFLTEQMEETQNFLSEINDAIDQKKMSKTDANVKSNELSLSTSRQLLKVKADLLNIIEIYTGSSEDLRNYRLSQSLDEVYSYYYEGNETDDETEEMNEQQELNQIENEFSGEPPAETTESILTHEAIKDDDPIRLLSIEHEYLITEDQNYNTEIKIYETDESKDSDRPNHSPRIYMAVGIGVFAFCVCLLFLISVLYRRSVQSRMFASKPIYETKSSSEITVVPVYENEISRTHRPEPSRLPGYLEVISGRIHNPSQFSDLDHKPTGDKITLIA